MDQNGRRIVIIGGGIAGLCAAVYAQRCGYETEVLEMHAMTGGLAMSWHRQGYTFETCLHWLVGSKPGGDFNHVWREVCDIDQLQFVFPAEMARIEDEHGEGLPIATNVDRLEKELLQRAPQDAKAIRSLAHDIRVFSKFRMPNPNKSWLMTLPTYLRNVPLVPALRRLTKMSGYEYSKRFRNPLLQSFFGAGEMGQMCALALVFSLAWHNAGEGGYSIGGSQALIHLIEKKLTSLGGHVRCGAKVERILVENDRAVGVRLSNGEMITADWVISAADGHATIYEMLGGRYRNAAIDRNYEKMPIFPSYLQVSFGVGRDLSDMPWAVSRILDEPIRVDPETEMKQIGFRIFHFDPTFAPPGKTAVTSLLMTRNFRYWSDLYRDDPEQYRAEKDRVADVVLRALERKIPGIREAVEVVDVSTPATVMRCTGNWKGSMEGWFLPPGVRFRALPNKLPGLQRFRMVGQWISPGGGLPAGLMTARPAIQAICKEDHVAFLPVLKTEEKPHWRLRTP
ncbi:MAG TPA: NAD(P)/FAD-dependent oxidoreductase [Acidobacteriaceae bacterium]|nr:NAD(P)/FAD-dependent oxidoreductase [Acidobacteriaceae bacterium]